MFKEFRNFILRGNAFDVAVGIIIGAAFSKIVDSLVKDVIMPPLGFLLKGVDFSNLFIVLKEGTKKAPYATLELAKSAGAITLNIGLFINTLITFFIIATTIFLLLKSIDKLRRMTLKNQTQSQEKFCPYCLSKIPNQAIKCAYCTSDL
ncbi:large conductance mechanosensitive channel protein MscL [Campylobacter cuniculorum]|uniref:large conductance mechanosensitive channel protein MscL n=1 Tax=Campylobacter cuniculorum TaxID=374106 RepID=UPI0023EF621D|nr:large conductance mechanosensitive channel protein MscL [Campylobacter cuniculorum]